jgi:transposase
VNLDVSGSFGFLSNMLKHHKNFACDARGNWFLKESLSAPANGGRQPTFTRALAMRRDFHHKLSTRIVREFDYVAVGNVNAAGLAKTNLAKSVLDAGWSSFRNMLALNILFRSGHRTPAEGISVL